MYFCNLSVYLHTNEYDKPYSQYEPMQHTHIKTVTNCRGISHPNNRPNSLCVLVLLSHNVPSHCDQITTFKGGFPRLLFKHLKIIKNYVVVFSTTTMHYSVIVIPIRSGSYLYCKKRRQLRFNSQRFLYPGQLSYISLHTRFVCSFCAFLLYNYFAHLDVFSHVVLPNLRDNCVA